MPEIVRWFFSPDGMGVIAGGAVRGDVIGDPAPVGVAAEGYLQHRQSLAFLTCRFRIINATARTVEDAFEGKYLERKVTVDGLWVEHGSKKRFQLGCDPALIEQAIKRGDGRPPCATSDYVADGNYRIDLRINLKAANIRPPGYQNNSGCELNPLEMSLCAPSETLQAAPKGHLGFARFDGVQKLGEAEVMVFSSGDNAGSYLVKYFMDPNRGFLPIQTSTSHKMPDGQYKESSITRMLDIRRCSRDRWFPMRSVTVHKVDPPYSHPVREFQVLDLDVDNPPPDSAFDMMIPAGYQVFNIATKDWVVVNPKEERVRISELPTVSDRFHEITRVEWEKQEAAKSRPIDHPSYWLGPWGAVVGVSVLLFLVSIWYLMYLRRRHPPQKA